MDLDGITLPDTLQWVDEYDWSPIVQSSGYGVTGSLFIQEGTKLKGRTITLTGTEEMGWVTRAIVNLLNAKRIVAGWQGTLTLPDAREFTVSFRNGENAIEVSPVVPHNQFGVSQYYRVRSIKLMEVEELV